MLRDGDVYLPTCPFCRKKVYSSDQSICDQEGHCHELCWWKRECARLQVLVDELKDSPDGSYSPIRPANHGHSLGSEPTILLSELPSLPTGEPV
jgi:hypothetical protein